MESGGFVDTSGKGLPDIQFHVAPALTSVGNSAPTGMHGMSINPCILRPLSRGRVRLRSANPADPALINANVLNDAADVDTLGRGVRLAMRIFEAPSLAKVISHRLRPDDVAAHDDDALRAYVRSGAKTVYHPAGTCKMGPASDPNAVVDPRLRLRGVENIRVADASVMPVLVSGNTNAPTMMIAQRAAEFIVADTPR
jgi:choline dehydrogenase-like flavoprotein